MVSQPIPPGHVRPPKIRPYDRGLLTIGFPCKALLSRCFFGGYVSGGLGRPAITYPPTHEAFILWKSKTKHRIVFITLQGTITYPTLGKRKSFFKSALNRGYVSSLEGNDPCKGFQTTIGQ